MKAKYNATSNCLVELPELNEPREHPADHAHGSQLYIHWFKEWEAYNEHLSKLRRISCHLSCVGKWSDGQEVEENKDYEVKLHYHAPDDKELIAFPLPVMSEDGWLTTKPNFTEECILITASKIRDKWHYNFWLIEKLDDMEGKWYWGILCPDGDEWGDLNDLEAEKYLIIPKLK